LQRLIHYIYKEIRILEKAQKPDIGNDREC